jgi:hypothetical protein
MWVLGRETVSVSQIQDQFRMGKRAKDILEELHKLDLVSDKSFNQPRTVLPTCYEALSPGVVAILERCGCTEERIQEAFKVRGGVPQ